MRCSSEVYEFRWGILGATLVYTDLLDPRSLGLPRVDPLLAGGWYTAAKRSRRLTDIARLSYRSCVHAAFVRTAMEYTSRALNGEIA